MSEFNLSALNESALNESPLMSGVATPTGLLVFNGFDCNDGTYMMITAMPDIENAPEREMDVINVPRSPGVKVANSNTREKIITARGVVVAATGPLLRAYIDTMKKSLRGESGTLTVTYQGITRRYVATLQNMGSMFSEKLSTDINKSPFELVFLTEGISTDWNYTYYTQQITALVDTVYVVGAGTTEAPNVITVVINAATAITALQIGSDNAGGQIKYTGALVAGDVLIFDRENQQVTLNGVQVNFTGFFPDMAVGDDYLRFTASGTSIDFRATIATKNAYL